MRRPLIAMNPGHRIKNIQFLTPLRLDFHKTLGHWIFFRKQLWILLEDFTFEFEYDGRKYRITVHKGFVTDLASIPSLFWWIYFPMDERYRKSAFAHDIFYGIEVFSRRFNDLFLFAGMKVEGSGKLTRSVFYHFVRNWGWLTYLSHSDESIKNKRTLIEVIEEAA